MASYHLSVKAVSRATGRSGPGAAAYRTASRIECERDGTVHDYTRRGGVEGEAFIVAPEGASWALDRSVLWNAAEAAEKRKDAKVAREYELALPCELDATGRRALAREFAEAVVERYGVAADVAVHAPGREGDRRNWHAHVLTTTRVAGAEGLGAKTRELDVAQTSGPAVEALRELWAMQVNRALERIQAEARVDHRSFARRGVAREAERHLGVAASGMERKAEARARAEVREQEQAREASERPEPERAGVEAAAAVMSAPALSPPAPPAPERSQEGEGWGGQGRREAVEAVPTLAAAGPAPEREDSPAAQHGPRTAREGRGGQGAVLPVSTTGPKLDRPVRASAGVYGAGAEPVTRIGRENAAIQTRNRAAEAARAAVERAQRVVARLERAARAGVAWVRGLAQGLGAQVVEAQRAREREIERQRQERERVEAERRAELERREQARLAELRRQEAERARPAMTQAQRDAARARGVWGKVEEAGRRAREQEAREAARRQVERAPRQGQGPSMGM